MYYLERLDSVISLNSWSYYKDVGIELFLYNFKIKKYNNEFSNDYYIFKNLVINDKLNNSICEPDLFLKDDSTKNIFNISDNSYQKKHIEPMKYFLQVIL